MNVGSRLGHYDVTALIGQGGMGEVYKATDTRLDRTVAIKVLPEHVAADPDLKQRFEREARTVAAWRRFSTVRPVRRHAMKRLLFVLTFGLVLGFAGPQVGPVRSQAHS